MATTRRATARDLPFLIHVLCLAAGGVHGPRTVQECHDDPELAQRLDLWTPDQTGLLCLDRSRQIGACWLTTIAATQPGHGMMGPAIPQLTIGIAPEHQGRGHGSYLLSATLQAADRAGVPSISLSVDDDNDHAIAMFTSAGFAPVSSGAETTVMLRVR